MRVLSLLLVMLMVTSGCARVAESRLNPATWFGGDEAEAAAEPQEIDPLVPPQKVVRQVENRPLISELTGLEVTPARGGVTIRAVGRADSPGVYSVELAGASVSDGVLTLDFRAFKRSDAGTVGVTAAQFFLFSELDGAERVTVRAQENSLTAGL
ncbi:MAG: hypothetical protein AAF092_03205 [Pseudomonadota bacterium]